MESSAISKANICPYYGREIPRGAELGLEPDKIYRLFRAPEELKKAAESFCRLPILIRHVPISAEVPRQDLIVGTTGSDVEFDSPYLKCSLSVWTADAIALIEAQTQRELSSAYRYDAVMQPGAYGGEPYDGRMENIRGNHVALVSEGRAGPDVFVADESPPEFRKMKLKHADRIAALKPYLAADADLLALDAEMDKEDKKAADEAEAAEDKAHDCYGSTADEWKSMSAKDKKSARDEWKKAEDQKAADKKAKDEKDDFESSKQKNGEDKAITADEMNAAIAAGVDAAVKRTNALHAAREAVKPIVGIVAMDSAEEVYAFALKHAGVKTDGVHPSAFAALLDVVKTRKAAPAPLAMDSFVGGHSVASIWPGARA